MYRRAGPLRDIRRAGWALGPALAIGTRAADRMGNDVIKPKPACLLFTAVVTGLSPTTACRSAAAQGFPSSTIKIIVSQSRRRNCRCPATHHRRKQSLLRTGPERPGMSAPNPSPALRWTVTRCWPRRPINSRTTLGLECERKASRKGVCTPVHSSAAQALCVAIRCHRPSSPIRCRRDASPRVHKGRRQSGCQGLPVWRYPPL